ncbi:Ig-like domain-containing protein [Fontibacter flavus]|uniref:Ig-like domain-containing protein n=1 Tax=Fontibacter flavus TaxID=654838 RepID=A0ABV6FP28_9BACT
MLKKKSFILLLLSLTLLVTDKSFAVKLDILPEEDGHSIFNEISEVEKPKLFFSNLIEDSEGVLVLAEEEYTFNPGEKVTVVAEPNQGFYFTHWEADGQKVSEAKEFVYTMPSKSVTLTGIFKKIVDPTVRIISPGNSASFEVQKDIPVKVQAESPNGKVTKVELLRNGIVVGSINDPSNSFIVSNLQIGTHSLTARVTDDKGARATSSAVTILVTEPNKVPIVSIISPKPAEVFPEGVDIRIEANASDPDGSISKVEFYRGSILVGTSTTSPYIITMPKVAPGSYNLTAKAFDNKNATAISSVVNVVVEKANVAPTVNISSPKNGDEFVLGSNIRIEAQASDSDGTVNKVEFYRGDVLIGTATSAPFAVTWSNVTTGTHSLTAKAFDDKGASKISAAVNINVLSEFEIPEISLVTPTDDQVLEEGSTVAFTVMFNGDSKYVKRVEYYAGSQLLGTSTSNPYNFDWKNVPVGEHELKAVVIGGTPEKIKNSNLVKLSVKPKPTIPFEITAPLRNSIIATGVDLTISVQVPNSIKKIKTVEYFRGNVKIGQTTIAPYDFVWKNVSSGEYNLVSRLVYEDNTVILSPVVKIFVEPFPGLSINYLVLDKPGQEDVEVQFTPTFLDLKSPVANVQYFVDENLVGTVDREPFILSWRGVFPGTYKVYAVAKDQNNLEFKSEEIIMEIKGEISVESEPEDLKMSYVLGPNPTSDFLNIHFSELEEEQEFEINVISMSGHFSKVFVAKTTDSSITIDVSNLKSGIYAIHLQNDGRYISGDKFIKR